MASTRSARLVLSGPAFTALLIAGAAAFPAPPGGDIAAAVRPSWLSHHTTAVIGQTYVRGFAAVAFVLLAVAVSGLCRRASAQLARAALAGGVAAGALMLLAQATALGSAQLVRADGSADATRALGFLQEGFLDLSSLPAAVLFGATALAALRTTELTRWFGWLSLAGVPIAIADAASYNGGPLEPFGVVGLVYFLLWALLAGTQLRPAEQNEPAATPRPAVA